MLEQLLAKVAAYMDGSHVPKADLATAQAAAVALQTQFDQATADLTTARASVKSLGDAAKATETELSTLRGQVASLTSANAALETRNTELNNTIADPKGEIAKRVNAIVAGQGLPPEKLPKAAAEDAGALNKEQAKKKHEELIRAGDSMAAAKFWETHRELLN